MPAKQVVEVFYRGVCWHAGDLLRSGVACKHDCFRHQGGDYNSLKIASKFYCCLLLAAWKGRQNSGVHSTWTWTFLLECRRLHTRGLAACCAHRPAARTCSAHCRLVEHASLGCMLCRVFPPASFAEASTG